MISLIIDNIFIEIRGASKDTEMLIWDKLSFQVYEFNPSPNAHPTIRHLFNRKTKLTYTGLLSYIQEILDARGEEYQLIDNREKYEPNANFKLVKYLDEEQTIPLELRDYQQKVVDGLRERDVIQSSTGSGKAICSSTCLLTPAGWKTIKDIHIGDTVYDENGKKAKVIGEYPQGLKDVYEVTFKDGTSIYCCKDHLWKYATRARHFDLNKCKVDTLEYMLKDKIAETCNAYKMAIPVNKPIEFDKKELFLHPYVLGLLLGNGGWTQQYAITFSNTEKDIVDRLKKLTKQYGEWHLAKNSNIQYYFTNLLNQKQGTNEFRKWIENTFKHCHSIDKFIPKEYLYSSIEDRLELVRGLIDTDGNVNVKGYISFYTVSKQLRDDFIFLVRSLGYRTSIISVNKRKEHEVYVINIWGCDDKLFSSEKHKARFANRKQPNKKHKYDILKIVDIKKLDYQEEMKCIAVDSPDHTYICEDFIVTHNTVMMAAAIAKFNVKPVAIFADKITLCQKLQSEMSKFLGEKVGLVGGGVNDIQDITVYSAQSVTEDMVKDVHAMFIDECHHTPSNTIAQISRWCQNAYYRVGVSATPWRDDNADMLIDAVFNKKNEDMAISASYLIQRGYLVPCTIYWVKQKQVFKSRSYQQLYNEAIVNNKQRNNDIITIAEQMRKYKKATILILVQRIEHGNYLLEKLRKKLGNNTKYIDFQDGKLKRKVSVNEIEFLSGQNESSKRNAVMQAIKNGDCHILLATTIADEGLDLPTLDCLILAGAGKSSTRALQRIGRVLRLNDNKKKAFIFDFLDMTPMLYRHAKARKRIYNTEPEFIQQEFPEHLLNH